MCFLAAASFSLPIVSTSVWFFRIHVAFLTLESIDYLAAHETQGYVSHSPGFKESPLCNDTESEAITLGKI
jgi:hypothetical protein